MVSDFSYLRDLYPPVITLDQLYRICHLSKRKAKWLLESRIIPCQDSGKMTRRFKIQLDDVISYLEDTASGKKVVHFPVGLFSSQTVSRKTAKHQKVVCCLEQSDFQQVLRQQYEKKFRTFPDSLSTMDVAKMTGFGPTAVNNWIANGKLKIYSRGGRFIPKAYVIDFCCSPYYYQLCCASSKHQEAAEFIESCVSPTATYV